MREYALLGETLLIFSVLVLPSIWRLRSEGGSSERFFLGLAILCVYLFSPVGFNTLPRSSSTRSAHFMDREKNLAHIVLLYS